MTCADIIARMDAAGLAEDERCTTRGIPDERALERIAKARADHSLDLTTALAERFQILPNPGGLAGLIAAHVALRPLNVALGLDTNPAFHVLDALMTEATR